VDQAAAQQRGNKTAPQEPRAHAVTSIKSNPCQHPTPLHHTLETEPVPAISIFLYYFDQVSAFAGLRILIVS